MVVSHFVDIFFRFIFVKVLKLFNEGIEEFRVIFFDVAFDARGIHDIELSWVEA